MGVLGLHLKSHKFSMSELRTLNLFPNYGPPGIFGTLPHDHGYRRITDIRALPLTEQAVRTANCLPVHVSNDSSIRVYMCIFISHSIYIYV